MKNILLIVCAGILWSVSYAQSKTPAFKPNAAIEKKISSFKFDTLKNFNDTRNDDLFKARFYSFKVVDITFEDDLVPVGEPSTNAKRYIGCKIKFQDSDGIEFGTVWAIKKSSKQGVWFSDFKKGKKKLWAAKISKFIKFDTEQFPVNTDSSFNDFITVDEYQKSSLFQSDEKKDSETLKVSETSAAMFKADMSIKSIVCIAEVRLDDYYNWTYEDCKETHWSLYITARTDDNSNSECFNGFVSKNSALGVKAKEIVKDGKTHKCIVKISHPTGETRSTIVTLERIEEIKSKE